MYAYTLWVSPRGVKIFLHECISLQIKIAPCPPTKYDSKIRSQLYAALNIGKYSYIKIRLTLCIAIVYCNYFVAHLCATHASHYI